MEFPRYDRNTSVCVSVYFIYLFIYLTWEFKDRQEVVVEKIGYRYHDRAITWDSNSCFSKFCCMRSLKTHRRFSGKLTHDIGIANVYNLKKNSKGYDIIGLVWQIFESSFLARHQRGEALTIIPYQTDCTCSAKCLVCHFLHLSLFNFCVTFAYVFSLQKHYQSVV